MVFIDAGELGWRPILKTWIDNEEFGWELETKDYIWNLFNSYIDPALKYVRKNLIEAMAQVSVNLHTRLFENVCLSYRNFIPHLGRGSAS